MSCVGAVVATHDGMLTSVEEARRRAYERRTDWPLTVAAVVFIVVYAWPILDPTLPPLVARGCAVANLAIWLAFGADYVIRLALASDRRGFFRRHLLDLVVLAVPVLRPLRALQVVVALARVNRRAAVSFRGRTTLYVVAAVLLLAFVAALAVLDAERGEPGATINSFGDALWWAATTITTVGYGDLFPVTAEGRVVGVGLMVGGITLVGVVTASLASWFVEHFAAADQAEEKTRGEIAELADEVRTLRALLESRGGDAAGAMDT